MCRSVIIMRHTDDLGTTSFRYDHEVVVRVHIVENLRRTVQAEPVGRQLGTFGLVTGVLEMLKKMSVYGTEGTVSRQRVH